VAYFTGIVLSYRRFNRSMIVVTDTLFILHIVLQSRLCVKNPLSLELAGLGGGGVASLRL
jgi:hypothetical protein